MSKKKKKLLLTFVCFLFILLSIFLLWVTDYLIDYTLMSTTTGETLSTDMKKSNNRGKLSTTQQKVVDWFSETNATPLQTSSFDGLSLSAMSYYQQTPSDLWLIGVHGYQSSYSAIEDIAMECHLRGYNVILPDLRGHGNSEGDYIGMGYHDSLDIISWINVIIQHNPQAKIALFGISMGGATVMMTAGQEELPSQVYAVIEDCGYSDAYTMVEEQLKEIFHLPAFPLLPFTNFRAEFRTNYNLKEASPIAFLETATIPILFIHGAEDKYVLPYMQEELYQSYEGEKEIFTVEGAGHTSSRRVDYDGYYQIFFEFLEQHQG